MARTKLAIALALAGVAFSSNALALGLGAIEVKSALNQPLDARIPLLSVEVGELDSLSISLGSAEAFHRAGVDRPFNLTRLKFRVVAGEKPYVRVFTEQPVKEPFLDFLVEADWSRGRLVREFTLLLDPPVFGNGMIAAPVRAAPIVPANPAVSAPVDGQGVAGAASPATAISPLPAGGAPADVAGVSSYGPVSASDTLWKIARDVRPDTTVSINQTMIALMRANPDAFINGDMNLLRRGATIQVPDAAVIAAIDAGQADREVRNVAERWRQQQAAQADSGRLQVLAPEGKSGEQLSSATREGAAESQNDAALQTELKLTREANASLESENDDLKSQVEGLKAEVARLERLLNVSAQQPVVGQADAAQAAQVPAEQPAQVKAVDDVQNPTPEAGVTDTAENASSEATSQAQAVEQSKTAEAEKPAAKPAAAEKPKAAPKPTPVVASGSEPGFLDDPRNLGMLGGLALVVLGLIYLIVRRRRKPEQLEVVDAGPPEPGIVVEDASEQDFEIPNDLVDEPELEPEASALDDMPPEGDVLSEADVYLAYGRYDQARELLEKAVRNDSGNTAARLKLLETVGLMHDVDAFAEQARQLRAQFDPAGESWQRVAQMGRDLLPGDPMFADDQVANVAAEEDAFAELADTPKADSDFGGFDLDEPELAPVAAQVEEEPAPSSSDDFSLDFELPEVAAVEEAPAEESVEELGFSLDFEETPVAAEQPEESATADDGLSFELDDLSFDEEPAATESNVVEFAQPGGSDDLAEIDELDEAGVKLDLARAYLDMGDSEGARNLLDEVLEEGSNRQRQEAQDLLKQIA